MKSYEETLNSIHKKVNIINEKKKKMKKITRTVLFSTVPLVILSVVIITAGTLRKAEDTVPSPYLTEAVSNPVTEAEATTQISENSTEKSSLYPRVWKEMNAFLVKWGDTTNETDFKTVQITDKDGNTTSLTIDYSGISVTIEKMFYSTMTETSQKRYGDAMLQLSELILPNDLIATLKKGETALVFVKLYDTVSVVSSDGTQLTTTDSEGNIVPLDKYRFSVVSGHSKNEYDPVYAIFPVDDGKIIISDNAYKEYRANYYYMNVIGYIQKANSIIKKKNLTDIVPFENGISIEKASEFFDYFCNSNYN